MNERVCETMNNIIGEAFNFPLLSHFHKSVNKFTLISKKMAFYNKITIELEKIGLRGTTLILLYNNTLDKNYLDHVATSKSGQSKRQNIISLGDIQLNYFK